MKGPMKTPPTLTKLCGLVATAVMIAVLSCASAEAKHKKTEEAQKKMINGIWKIVESKLPEDTLISDDYLPVGTRIRIEAIEPSPLELPNELIGEIELLLPLSNVLCKGGLGESAKAFSPFCTLCTNGQISQEKEDRTFDVYFTFQRLTKEDIEEDLFFSTFKELGARAGDKAVAISVKNIAVSWDLWFRGPNEMVSHCMADIPGSSLSRDFYMVWQREK